MKRIITRVVVALLTVVGATVVTALSEATPASALCATSTIEGDWRNIDANTTSITRIVVDDCASKTIDNGDGTARTIFDCCTFVNPYGSCSPSDCDWGRREATAMHDGWMRAVYTHSWARKDVWIRSYEFYGRTYLRVWVNTDFTEADGRTDYVTDEWMLPA